MRWRDAGMLRPIDRAVDPRPGCLPEHEDLPGSIDEDGLTCFFAADCGNLSVLCHSGPALEQVDMEDRKNESWAILFDEEYAERLGILDSIGGLVAVIGSLIGAAWEEATKLLLKQREFPRYRRRRIGHRAPRALRCRRSPVV